MGLKKNYITILVAILLILSVFSAGLVLSDDFSSSSEKENNLENDLKESGISIDSTSNTIESEIDNGDVFTWNHTTGDGDDDGMVMVVGLTWSPGEARAGDVTYGGEGFSLRSMEMADVRTELWLLTDPPRGEYPIEVEVDNDDAADVIAGGITFTGVDQEMPDYDSTGTSEDADSISVEVDSRPGDMVMDVVAQTSVGVEGDPTAGQTVQWSFVGEEDDTWGAGSTKPADSETTIMSWETGEEDVMAISALTLALDEPEINLTRPEGGEEWEAGTEEEIRWNTTEGAGEITGIDLEYSIDDGQTWEQIATDIDDSGSYLWEVPKENSDEARIRARVVDENDRIDIAESDTFALGELPEPPENVSVEHWGDPIMEDPPMMVFDDFSDGDHTSDPEWTVHEGDWDVEDEILEGEGTISTGEDAYRAYGRWEYNFSLERTDWDDDYQMIRFYFIQTGDPDPEETSGYFVTVTGEGGYGWNPQINLWRMDEGGMNRLSSVEWEPDTDWHTLAIERNYENEFNLYLDGENMGSAEDGTYTTSEYKGFLMQGDEPEDRHNIDEIKISAGEDNRITWERSPDDPEIVDHYNIYRSENRDGPWDEPIDSVDADGSESYEYIDEGKGEAHDTYWWYVVRAVGIIEEENNNSVREPGPPQVTINSPDGGEVWRAYETQTIEWEMKEGYDEIYDVTLFSSPDGGETWDEIENSLLSSGSYDWTVSNYNSTECLVKVSVEDVDGRVSENVSSNHFTVLGEPPEPPENLTVEHSDPIGELVENGIFEENYESWELTRLQDEGVSDWDEEGYEEGGSIFTQAVQSGDGTTTEESYWEQDIVNTSSSITVNGAFSKRIWLEHVQCSVNRAVVQIQVNDTEEGWRNIHGDGDNTEQDPEWIEFGSDTYDPTGKVTSLRAHMQIEAEGSGGDRTAIGEMWMDNISVVSEGDVGDEHNLLTWDASLDDPEEVSHYNIYRSEDRDGPWDEPIDNVEADGSTDYSYLDEDRGMADDIYWWYVVRAVGENDMEEDNTNEVQEPFEVDHIEVNPQESTITAGETQGYNATAYDEENNEIRDVTDETEWSIEDGAGGDWDENVYTSEFSGTWNVTATYTRGGEEFKDNSTLTVEPSEVSNVEIDPEEDQNVVAGQDLVFSASAYDEYGNIITDEPDDFTWQNAVDGVFNEEVVDEYEVKATYDEVDSVTVTVTVEPAEADHIEVQPKEETIYAGETVAYYSETYDEYGNMIEEVTDETSWSIEDGAGGDWSENIYESENPGEWIVTGTYSDMTAEASLTVLSEEDIWVEIVDPEEDEVLPPDVTVEWKSENAEYHEIRLNEEEWIDVGIDTSYTFEDLEEGEHLVEVQAIKEDMSDHDMVNFTVEIIDPTIDIITPEEGDTVPSEVTVKWMSENAEFHEIRLNEEEWIDVGIDTSYTFEDLEEGEHLVEVKAIRGEESAADSVTFTVDPDIIYVNIISPDEGEVFDVTDVTVEWVSENAEYHEIRLNEKEWRYMGSETDHTFTDLEEGEYFVEVRAVRGEESTVDSVLFDIELISLNIDSPEEGEVFEETEVTVEWVSENAEYHEIRLNEEGWIYMGSETDHTFTDLEDGEYTAEVKAVRGEHSTTDSVTFHVELGDIEIEITSPEDGYKFDVPEVTVEWVSENAEYHEIRLNEPEWTYVGTETDHTFTDLEEGEHLVEVKAVRGEHSITDSVLFDVELISLNINSPEEGEVFKESEVTVEWMSENAEFHEIRINEGGWIDVGIDTSYTFEDLEEGEHLVEVKAVRGEESAADSISFNVELEQEPLLLDLDSPDEEEIFNVSEVTVEWKSENADSHEIRINEGGWISVGSSTSYDFEDLDDGEYTLEVKAVRGEESLTRNVTIIVDTTPPDLEVIEPLSGEAFNQDSITIRWNVSDTPSGLSHLQIRIDEDDWITISIFNLKDLDGVKEYEFTNLSDGRHTVEVQAEDNAGNVGNQTIEFLVDTVPPEISFVSPEEGEVLDKDSVTVKWEVSDTLSGVDYYEIKIDGEDDWIEIGSEEYNFTELADGEYTLELRAVDNAGNRGEETVNFEVSAETDEEPFYQSSCLLLLILAVIIALLLAVWYGWKRSEEEKKEVPEKRKSPPEKRKEMRKTERSSTEIQGPEAGAEPKPKPKPDVPPTTTEAKMRKEKSEWREDKHEVRHEEKPDVASAKEKSLGKLTELEKEEEEEEEEKKTLKDLSEEEEVDVDKLEVVEKFQNIKGIGSGIAHALYEAGYRSMEELKEAKVDDIKSIDGIGLTQAELIYDSIQKDEEKTKKTPTITEEDLKAHELGPMVKGREMKKESEQEKKDTVPHIQDSDMKAQQIDSKVFEEKEKIEEEPAEEVEKEERGESQEVDEMGESEDITREESLNQLSQLEGVGPSKAENLYESGFRTLEDLDDVSKEDLKEVKGIGPALSEKILDSLEDLKK